MPEFQVRPVAPEATRALRQAVLRPHQSLEELATHEPPAAFAVGAFDGGELVAVGLIGPEGGPRAWRVRGMATAPYARGQGAGTAVLDALLRHALSDGAQRIWCRARTGARSLYERAGFDLVSEEFDLPDIGPHVVMERRTIKGSLKQLAESEASADSDHSPPFLEVHAVLAARPGPDATPKRSA